MVLFNKISVMDEEDGLIDLEEFSFSMNLKDHSLMSISLFKALDTNKVFIYLFFIIKQLKSIVLLVLNKKYHFYLN